MDTRMFFDIEYFVINLKKPTNNVKDHSCSMEISYTARDFTDNH